MNREGLGLLGVLIDRMESLTPLVMVGDCKSITITLNTFLPIDLQITPSDVYLAMNTRSSLGGFVKMNSQVLRARIDAIPSLYSARISGGSGGWQTIANELNMDPNVAEQVSIKDVQEAMDLNAVPAPERVMQGAVAMVGIASLG